MNEFMELKDPLAGIYELTAVLIHRGTTAYSGHYVAHILDKQVCIHFTLSFMHGCPRILAGCNI